MKKTLGIISAVIASALLAGLAMCSTETRAQPRIDVGSQPVVYGSNQVAGAPWGTPLPVQNAYGSGTSVQYANTTTSYGNQPLPAVGAVQGGMQVVGYETEVRSRPCTPQEESSRSNGYAVFGGILGAAYGARENSNEAGRLGIIGALAGKFAGVAENVLSECTVSYTVRVPVMRPVAVNAVGPQQAAYRNAPATKEVASRCVVNGKPRKGLTEEECDELALELSKTKTVSAQNTAPAQDSSAPKAAGTATESKENNPCSDGRIPLKLTKRGHALEGKMVCVKTEFRNHPDFQ